MLLTYISIPQHSVGFVYIYMIHVCHIHSTFKPSTCYERTLWASLRRFRAPAGREVRGGKLAQQLRHCTGGGAVVATALWRRLWLPGAGRKRIENYTIIPRIANSIIPKGQNLKKKITHVKDLSHSELFSSFVYHVAGARSGKQYAFQGLPPAFVLPPGEPAMK